MSGAPVIYGFFLFKGGSPLPYIFTFNNYILNVYLEYIYIFL